MGKAGTYKDIAKALGVSLATVHKAVHNKKGVGEATRVRILSYISENDYTLNRAASALKRGALRLAVAMAEPTGESGYFYPQIMRGVERAKSQLESYNVELKEYYFPFDAAKQRALLERILEEEGDSLDGIMTVASDERRLNDVIKRYTDRGIKFVTVNSDAPESTRDASVCGNGLEAGRVAAELMYDFTAGKTGQILLLAGSHEMSNHRESARGFISVARELMPECDVIECCIFDDAKKLEKHIEQYVSAIDDMIGVYCNNARNTLTLCKTLSKLGAGKRYAVIGSDVYGELTPYFEDRTLTAAIYQYPQEQGSRGLWMLYGLVTGTEKIRCEKSRVGIIVKGNAKEYINADGNGEL